MKFRFNYIYVLLICMMSFGQDVKFEENTKSGDLLVIKLRQLEGNIKIKGWDKNIVSLEGSIDNGEDNPARLKKISDGFRLQLKYSDNDNDDDNIDADLTIRVPINYRLTINTQTELSIENVEGEFDLGIANEDAVLKKLKGRADIYVVNGTLDVYDSDLEGSLRNINGDMTVDESSFVGELSATNAKIMLDKAPKGVTLNCTNGDIRINQASQFVEASTVNANLIIQNLDGRLEFESTNGSVEANLFGDSQKGDHSIDIKTLNGSAKLEIPSNYSMSFDVEVRESNSRMRYNYEVTSEFDAVKIRTEDEGQRDYVIYGSGKIGNGKNKAKIRLINGNANLKKSN